MASLGVTLVRPLFGARGGVWSAKGGGGDGFVCA